MELIIDKTVETDEFDGIIEKAVGAALCEEGFPDTCQISVTLCTDEEITALNGEYMEREGPTDVLSFPMLMFDEEGAPVPESMVYDGESLVLGDIVISIDRAKSQAAEYGHSVMREVGFLTVHSMLHLTGYDHMEEEERALMQEKEKKILAAINLPRTAEESAEERK